MFLLFALLILLLVGLLVLVAVAAGSVTAVRRMPRFVLTALGVVGVLAAAMLTTYALARRPVDTAAALADDGQTPSAVEAPDTLDVVEAPDAPNAAEEGQPPVEASKESGTAPPDAAEDVPKPDTPKPDTPKPDAPKRPAWITSPGEDAVVVSSIPYSSWAECREDVNRQIEAAAGEYVDRYLHRKGASKLLHFDAASIRERFYADEYLDAESYAPDKQIHALLRFDPSFRREIELRWKPIRKTSRAMAAGIALGALLAVLAVGLVYLRWDIATGGRCRGRLRLAAVAAILALAASGVCVARWLPWV